MELEAGRATTPVFIHTTYEKGGKKETTKDAWHPALGKPGNTSLAKAVKGFEKSNPGSKVLEAEVKTQSGKTLARYKGASIAQRVVTRFQGDDLNFSERVVSRFVAAKVAYGKWDGKFVGKDARLRWSDAQWLLEELPQKGKKKLRVATMQNPFSMVRSTHLMPVNILEHSTKLSRSDSYDAIKKKIQKAMEEAAKLDVEKGYAPKWVVDQGSKWYENQVYFLEVVPEDVEPFKAKGKDFTVDVAWTDFKAYSPSSDFQQADPHYTAVRQKSKGAARKLYQTLKADPNALKSVPWSKFTDWLTSKKIGYDMIFSTWH